MLQTSTPSRLRALPQAVGDVTLLRVASGSTAVRHIATERYDALDALRAAAMLLGVVLHGAVSYMTCRMPRLLWPVLDQGHVAFDWLFWWIHSFRLPLFFLMAGFFSAQLWERRGGEAYLANRTRRILIPLAAACAVILPLTYLIWSCGWLLTGQCSPGQVLRIKFAASIQNNVYGLAHLWFLEHLFLMSAGYWLWRSYAAPRWAGALPQLAGLAQRALLSPWRPLWWSLPGIALLWLDPDVVADFHNTFVPEPLRLAHYALFFAAGTSLYRLRGRLQEMASYSRLYLALSLPVLVSMGLLLRQYLSGGLTPGWRLALSADMTLLAWLSVFGWLGVFLKRFQRPIAAVRYLSDASYWIYLVHLPLVGLVQVALYAFALPVVVKFLAAVTIPIIVTLATYRDLVRHTRLGAAIGGRRAVGDSWPVWRKLAYGMAAVLFFGGLTAGLWSLRAFCFDGNRHVVLAGQVYRSAQPAARELTESIHRFKLQSVINLQGGDPANARFAHERRVCQAAGVMFLGVDLLEDSLPSRRDLTNLIAALDRAPPPVLVHGRFGIARSGLAAAMARLLAGDAPEDAMDEFSWRHGSLDRTPYDSQRVVEAYQSWLARRQTVHSPQQFRHWAARHYDKADVLLETVRESRSLPGGD